MSYFNIISNLPISLV